MRTLFGLSKELQDGYERFMVRFGGRCQRRFIVLIEYIPQHDMKSLWPVTLDGASGGRKFSLKLKGFLTLQKLKNNAFFFLL